MQKHTPTLHLLCGKIASGKSSLAADLGRAPDTVIIAEDAWLAALFSDQMATRADYLRRSTKLQSIMAPHVLALLKAGVSVVLDFPANTVAQRAWMREVVEKSDAPHQMHVLNVSDDVCLQRLLARNLEGEHAFAATEEQFRRFTAHFVPPTDAEGFEVIHH